MVDIQPFDKLQQNASLFNVPEQSNWDKVRQSRYLNKNVSSHETIH